jgi:hypothetical protein
MKRVRVAEATSDFASVLAEVTGQHVSEVDPVF